MATQPRPSLTAQEYLALDRAAEFKSEFVDGIMYAMAGGSIRHSLLAAQLIADLTAQLRGRCSVLTSDARVWTPVSGAYFFPDVSVVCGDPQTQEGSDDTLTNPCLIAEVLSPSTADYDHGKKFAHYREIPTLDIYLLIHPDKILIEHFARQSDSHWLPPNQLIACRTRRSRLHDCLWRQYLRKSVFWTFRPWRPQFVPSCGMSFRPFSFQSW